MSVADPSEQDRRPASAISLQQLAAMAAPGRRTSDLIGNFGEFGSLFEQLGEPVVIELGKPLPEDKYLPRKRIGSCSAAHNDALLGKKRR